jgi:hypothetical protein
MKGRIESARGYTFRGLFVMTGSDSYVHLSLHLHSQDVFGITDILAFASDTINVFLEMATALFKGTT